MTSYIGIKRKRCECKGYLLSDCGKCKFYIDKPKFGGPSNKKKRSIVQKCERNVTTMSSTHLNEGRDISYHAHYMCVLYYIYFVEQVPVYFCKPSSSSSDDCDKYVWNIIKPLKYSRINLPELDEGILLKPGLYYYENSHYDVIVSDTTGKVSSQHPILPTHNEYVIDLCILYNVFIQHI